MTYKLLVRTVDSKSYVHQAAIARSAEPEKILRHSAIHTVVVEFDTSAAANIAANKINESNSLEHNEIASLVGSLFVTSAIKLY